MEIIKYLKSRMLNYTAIKYFLLFIGKYKSIVKIDK